MRACACSPPLLGLAAVLVSCGSSGNGLIPAENAGPLRSDFEAVAKAAQAGNGNCTATTEAINKTEQDFAALPSTIDAGLRSRLSQGISNLRTRALEVVHTATRTDNHHERTAHDDDHYDAGENPDVHHPNAADHIDTHHPHDADHTDADHA